MALYAGLSHSHEGVERHLITNSRGNAVGWFASRLDYKITQTVNAFSLAAGGGQYVLGCGSNVVDHIYNVQGKYDNFCAVKT